MFETEAVRRQQLSGSALAARRGVRSINNKEAFMYNKSKLSALALGVLILLSQHALFAGDKSHGGNYKIVRTNTSMNVQFSYTKEAEDSAKRDGKTLDAMIQGVNPFMYITLLQAAGGGKAFQGYYIYCVYGDGSLNIVALISGKKIIDVTDKKHPVVKSFYNNIKNSKLAAGGKSPIKIYPAETKGIKLVFKK